MPDSLRFSKEQPRVSLIVGYGLYSFLIIVGVCYLSLPNPFHLENWMHKMAGLSGLWGMWSAGYLTSKDKVIKVVGVVMSLPIAAFTLNFFYLVHYHSNVTRRLPKFSGVEWALMSGVLLIAATIIFTIYERITQRRRDPNSF